MTGDLGAGVPWLAPRPLVLGLLLLALAAFMAAAYFSRVGTGMKVYMLRALERRSPIKRTGIGPRRRS